MYNCANTYVWCFKYTITYTKRWSCMLWKWLLLIHFSTTTNLTLALQLNKLLVFYILCIIFMFFLLNIVFDTYIVLFHSTHISTRFTNQRWSLKYASGNILRHEIDFVLWRVHNITNTFSRRPDISTYTNFAICHVFFCLNMFI